MKHCKLLPMLGAWLLAALLAVGLAACGGGDASSSSGLTLAEGSGVANESSGADSSGANSSGITSSGAESSQVSEKKESSQVERHMMTVDETLEYFATLDPAKLGLEGETMDQYQTYPNEKAIPVDGLPCMKVIVYSDSEVGTNEPEATFLVARDGTAIYRLEDGVAIQVDY